MGKQPRLSLADLIEGTAEAFAFLVSEHGYVFAHGREPSACPELRPEVLRWENPHEERSLVVYLVPLEGDYTHYVTALRRHPGGEAPAWYDNDNVLGLQRVLAYHGIRSPGLPMTRWALLENFRFYARVLREHDEPLSAAGWFDRKRLLANERELYVLDWDWKRDPWLDEVTDKLAQLIGGEGDVVSTNTNDRAPWDLCGPMVEVRRTSGELAVRLGPGHTRDPRDPAYAVTVITPRTEVTRDLGVVGLQEIADAVTRELAKLEH